MPSIEMSDEEYENFLEHYGTKGMKWGVRKPNSNDIRTARAKTFSKQREYGRQVDRVNLAAPGGKVQAREAKKLNEISMEFLRNPDRATAMRLTRGEKALLAVIAIGVPGPGTAAATGFAAGRFGARKVIERQVRKANES